ncbi:MAG: hypothetical protein QOK26_1003 [Pseudonocardiales bacterium]|jgi:heme/copper-type cytochrome/quinol oxidase subunit 4|nr:hypothetical protein [Pseudonocardia sp.]MDT7598926.1 hypothetical protein [Pseudonocardiales bacterium]
MTLLRNPATIVWLVLVLATSASTWLLSKDAFSPVVGTIGVFLIAAVKIRLVIMRFMEINHAPRPWRIYFEAWVVGATALILGFYLVS